MSESPEKTALQKLSIILPHLIEHNKSHACELEKWADDARAEGAETIAHEVSKAAGLLLKSVEHLNAAFSEMDGSAPVCGKHHEHKSRHHDHNHGHDHDHDDHHHHHDHHGHNHGNHTH